MIDILLPDRHIIYGILLTLTVWLVFPNTSWFYLSLLFLSSIFIDVDHYIWYVKERKDWNLKNAYYYLKDKKDKRRKLFWFHTIEFIIFIGLLSYIWKGFSYIFIGLIFHSILDIMDIKIYKKDFKERVFSFFDSAQ